MGHFSVEISRPSGSVLNGNQQRYGFRADAARIFQGLFEASTYIDLKRLPELICGFQRLRSHGPTFYHVACAPQAWAAASILSLVQSCRGLGFDPENGTVVFDQPVVPEFSGDITLRQLSLGQDRLDAHFARANSEVAVSVLARSGAVRALTRI
jgi:glycogen debranching enzyme